MNENGGSCFIAKVRTKSHKKVGHLGHYLLARNTQGTRVRW